jgi:hypothetical protein
MLFCASTATAAVLVRVVPESPNVIVGTRFSVRIVADASLPILGWGLDLQVTKLKTR